MTLEQKRFCSFHQNASNAVPLPIRTDEQSKYTGIRCIRHREPNYAAITFGDPYARLVT